MKLAIRCIYHLAVVLNFLIIDLERDLYVKFANGNTQNQIDIIRPYLPEHYPSIKLVSWIPIEGLTKEHKATLIWNLV